MAALRFRDASVRRQCCDLDHIRARWGADVARRLSRRLQQIEAMTTLDDLGFLPFDSFDNGDGSIQVMVTPELALVVEPAPEERESEAAMPSATITVTRVLATSRAARSS